MGTAVATIDLKTLLQNYNREMLWEMETQACADELYTRKWGSSINRKA
jgi:hypothetical protein